MSEDVAKGISYYFMKVSNEQIQCCVCGACFDSGQHGIYVTHLKSRHNKIFQGIKKEESNKGLTKKSNEDKHPSENTVSSQQYVEADSQFQCLQCDKFFSHKNTVKKHIKYSHEGIKYGCDHCNFQSTRKDSLRSHVQSIHTNAMFSCIKCDKKYKQEKTLRLHIESVHEGVRYACTQCEQQYPQKQTLKAHMENIHEGLRFACNYCGKHFQSKSSVNYHIQSKHKGDKVSPKVKVKKSFVWDHFKDNGADKLPTCHHCGKGVLYKQYKHSSKHSTRKGSGTSSLRMHILRNHADKLEPQLLQDLTVNTKCSCCDKVFRFNIFRTMHEAKHKPRKFHKSSCSYCGKVFPVGKALKQHEMIHLGIKPHKCDTCGKNFRVLEQLKSHRRVHTGETPYQCQKCFKKFKFQSSRDNHKCISRTNKVN